MDPSHPSGPGRRSVETLSRAVGTLTLTSLLDDDEYRERRVGTLRLAIQAGTYLVSASALADAIIASILRHAHNGNADLR